ncbi:14 kDa phosphohistidine phosphatase-like [Achroia grisella]|uniref:14 kDa phosphohistidine phosphatase-like n=1 Tax=Achroia grisella TaxID=688607 RepID=UPI0027D309C5|nr:14 kDa phosphohistidine phosphatase-like [Achroia grisella]
MAGKVDEPVGRPEDHRGCPSHPQEVDESEKATDVPHDTDTVRTRLLRAGGASLISLQTIKTMASSSLADVPTVDIDPSGVFKYLLIKLYDRKQSEENFVYIVRGYCRCIYHSDVYVEVQEKLHPLDCDIVGGGSISHEPSLKKIRIYGHAHGYGKADHEITAKLIKAAFPNYKITISDKAY